MKSYNVICDQGHEFDGWFKDNATFDQLVQMEQVQCPDCHSNQVKRTLSSPNITTTRQKRNAQHEEMRNIRKQVVALNEAIKKNCDDVGDQFAEEARKIKKGETPDRAIYGQATADEVEELHAEGITCAEIPWIDKTTEN